jgi:hypothetical protein
MHRRRPTLCVSPVVRLSRRPALQRRRLRVHRRPLPLQARQRSLERRPRGLHDRPLAMRGRPLLLRGRPLRQQTSTLPLQTRPVGMPPRPRRVRPRPHAMLFRATRLHTCRSVQSLTYPSVERANVGGDFAEAVCNYECASCGCAPTSVGRAFASFSLTHVECKSEARSVDVDEGLCTPDGRARQLTCRSCKRAG